MAGDDYSDHVPADLKSSDLAEPAFLSGLCDPADEVASDLDEGLGGCGFALVPFHAVAARGSHLVPRVLGAVQVFAFDRCGAGLPAALVGGVAAGVGDVLGSPAAQAV
ncbi:hypothetical protein ACWGDE_16200 [Streptomyces sp. NPDC054956]